LTKAKVQDFQLQFPTIISGQDQVGWFQTPVSDATLVQVMKHPAELHHMVENAIDVPFLGALKNIIAVYESAYQIGNVSALDNTEVEDVCELRMPESSQNRQVLTKSANFSGSVPFGEGPDHNAGLAVHQVSPCIRAS